MSSSKFLVIATPLLGLAIFGQGCSAAEKVSEAQGALCCKDFTVGADLSNVDWEISGEGKATFSAFMNAAADFSATASAVVNDVGSACQALAVDLGEKDDAVTETLPDVRATKWCQLAAAKIQSEITAKGKITVVAQPPSCSFSASAQASCEGKCSANASCQAELGDIKARCDPGQLSGKCEAECSGTCEGSANLAVTCTGQCSGTCEGKCDGQAMGSGASGQCAGKCEGTCRGSCKADASAKVTCEGSCTGGCSVELKAPKCKVELKEPSASCKGNAECSGSCKASASAKAECKEGSLTIQATGSINAQALASLKLNLPKILAVVQARGKILATNAEALASASVAVSGNAPNFSAKAALCVVPAAVAITQAVTNAKAGVTASASVSASVGL